LIHFYKRSIVQKVMEAQDPGQDREMMMELAEVAARKQEAMKESMQRWKAERDNNADYIAKLKQNKEERKKEIEAQEALLLQMKEEEEAAEEAAAVEEKMLQSQPQKTEKSETDTTKQNFGDQKKKFTSKVDQEYEDALNSTVKPFDVKTMDQDQMKKKVEELYDVFTNLINDKISLNKKMVDQDSNIKALREKLNEILDARAAKKGQIDMHKFYPGQKKTSHPPKMQIFSKYDNRKGTRSYDERKEMYDEGIDVVRPKMLASVWAEKFNAWLSENPEE